MDKQILKVKKQEKKAQSSIKKSLKETDTLLKMDKKFDAKLRKCGKKAS